jgi:hypothetical protein
VLHGITLYYDSICQEIDRNFHRREIWLQEITDHYNSTRQEMATILQKLQSEQHLRTIIMWNRLHPHLLIGDIVKQGKKEFETPSLVPCDVQQLITTLSKNHKMTILDLHGDMSFNQLEKVLYTLRYGRKKTFFYRSKPDYQSSVESLSSAISFQFLRAQIKFEVCLFD